MKYKQAIVIRTDLEMSTGKIAAQACHASLEAALKTDKRKLNAWRREGAKKVVLQVPSQTALLNLEKAAKKEKLASSLISDAGLTELEPGTITALAIGPDSEKDVDKITGALKAL